MGIAAAKSKTSNAIQTSSKKSEQLQAALLDEMKGSSSLKNAGEHLAARAEMKEGLFNYFLRPLFWLSNRQRKDFD